MMNRHGLPSCHELNRDAGVPSSRQPLAHDLRRCHDPALAGGELPPRLRYRLHHTLAPSLGQATTQDRHQLGLRIRIELLGRIEDVAEKDRLIHGDLPARNHTPKLPYVEVAGKRPCESGRALGRATRNVERGWTPWGSDRAPSAREGRSVRISRGT